MHRSTMYTSLSKKYYCTSLVELSFCVTLSTLDSQDVSSRNSSHFTSVDRVTRCWWNPFPLSLQLRQTAVVESSHGHHLIVIMQSPPSP